MPIDKSDIRENPDQVRESQQKRQPESTVLIDQFLESDKKVREILHEISNIRGKINSNSKQFSECKKRGEDTTSLVEETKTLKAKVAELEKEISVLEGERESYENKIGNLVHPSVPVSMDEADNEIVRIWGANQVDQEGLLPHPKLMEKLGWLECERGVKIMGHRGYFLKGWGVKLNFALIQYALQMLEEHDYQIIQTPYIMNKDLMAKTAQLEDFDEMLYKVADGEQEKYLIATSEQPLSAIHANEWLEENSLPIRYAGHSHCFRKEAGSSGKDQQGIFRVHQFEKVEQFSITKPEDSWAEHERMLAICENFYQSLRLPYRVVTIVSGALNNAASKKYDLEGWFPTENKYRELVSCSNCTDYQSRSLEVRCGAKKAEDKRKRYVHMLNCTMMANTRTICCILENYQTKDGIIVPERLRGYLGGVEFIPFVH